MNVMLRLLVAGVLFASAFLIVAAGMARSTTNLLAPVHLLVFLIALAFYILPSVLAYYRDCEATVWIALVNVFLGWTIFAWFIALGWAAGGKVRTMAPGIAAPSGQALHLH